MTIVVTKHKQYAVVEGWHEAIGRIQGVRDGIYDSHGPMVELNVRPFVSSVGQVPVLIHIDDIVAVEYE